MACTVPCLKLLPPPCCIVLLQHTAFMALTLLSEFNSVCRLAGKLLAMAAPGGGNTGLAASLAGAVAAADRATFVLFRCVGGKNGGLEGGGQSCLPGTVLAFSLQCGWLAGLLTPPPPHVAG